MTAGRDVADVAVVGAGLNGLAVALALGGGAARPPLDVRIIDAGDPGSRGSAAFDGRASAITLSSRRLFEALGLWQRLDRLAEPVREIVVTDSHLGQAQRPALLQFGEVQQPGQPAAYMAENRHLYDALYDAVAASPSIRMLPSVRVERFAFGDVLAKLDLDDGAALKATLVIGADGRDSAARQAAGIEMFGWSYGQTAIVTTVAHEFPHGGRAEEHFLPAGPFAILPLAGNRSSLVWTEEAEEARRILALDAEGFAVELRRRFGGRLGTVEPTGPRHGYPLSLQLARRFVGPRLALLGDAAHVVHPIAGLGFNLGLRDIAALAETVIEDARLGLDFGSRATLERYEAWRRLDTVMVAVATDGLSRLFSTGGEPLKLLRDTGLLAVNRMEPLKTLFVREAAGLTGRLPRLLQGEPV